MLRFSVRRGPELGGVAVISKYVCALQDRRVRISLVITAVGETHHTIGDASNRDCSSFSWVEPILEQVEQPMSDERTPTRMLCRGFTMGTRLRVRLVPVRKNSRPSGPIESTADDPDTLGVLLTFDDPEKSPTTVVTLLVNTGDQYL